MQYFTKRTIKFLTDLSKNNSKEWFQDNRKDFNEFVLEPSKAFVENLGQVMRDFCPSIKAIPKTDKSIFRMHRDTRFSANKDPYKTNMGLYFWEGDRKKMECPGFYFHIEPKSFFLGSGSYIFPNDILKQYRKSVALELPAKELHQIIDELVNKYNFELGGKHYKKIPRGFKVEHDYKEFILHNGLWIGTKNANPAELIKIEDQVSYAADIYKKMNPIHNWIMENLY